MSLLGLTLQLRSVGRLLVRPFSYTSVQKPVPLPRGAIKTPQAFLKSIGRSSEEAISVEEWDVFWKMSGAGFKKAGVSVRDRRYIMWCMGKYLLGWNISQFAYEAKTKKKVRGHGPAVQNGKRIRSRRLR